jgi:hypothetical protein
MGLFGFGTKRKPEAAEHYTPNKPVRRNTPIAVRFPDLQAGVEVSEFNLPEDDFSSLFGETQFADARFDQDDQADPWSSKLHLD